ncbi:hypothetical protein K4K49_003251 [Colletotrichum sp. SAR 10_70]|nr:hypothetical protein K4K50_001703 [Colletotrichum sp. SAR 10_71]KAI8173036.1 hypothetical protein K4K49_003251 [Colletotrichum sp. SAR 10_70]
MDRGEKAIHTFLESIKEAVFGAQHIYRHLRTLEASLVDNLKPCEVRRRLPDHVVSIIVSCLPEDLFKVNHIQIRPKLGKAAQKWKLSDSHILFYVAYDYAAQGQPFFTSLRDFADAAPKDWHRSFQLLAPHTGNFTTGTTREEKEAHEFEKEFEEASEAFSAVDTQNMSERRREKRQRVDQPEIKPLAPADDLAALLAPGTGVTTDLLRKALSSFCSLSNPDVYLVDPTLILDMDGGSHEREQMIAYAVYFTKQEESIAICRAFERAPPAGADLVARLEHAGQLIQAGKDWGTSTRARVEKIKCDAIRLRTEAFDAMEILDVMRDKAFKDADQFDDEMESHRQLSSIMPITKEPSMAKLERDLETAEQMSFRVETTTVGLGLVLEDAERLVADVQKGLRDVETKLHEIAAFSAGAL